MEIRLPTPGRSLDVATGDLDRNGIPDLVALTDNPNHLVVFPGSGGAAFGTPIPNPVTSSATRLRIADVDGDAVQDVVVAATNRVTRYRGVGDGTFPTEQTISLIGAALAVDAGDLDEDGDVDLITASTNKYIVAAEGTAHFTSMPTIPFGTALDVHPGVRLLVPRVGVDGRVRIDYELARPDAVRLSVIDVRGRRLWSFAPPAIAGKHAVDWSARAITGRTLSRGVYFVELTTSTTRVTRKLPSLH